MSDDDKKERSRFSAVAEELTTPDDQLKATPAAKATSTPQLFETWLQVVGGKLTPCPKCGNTAFSLNAQKSSATCRGCPLPAPTYPLEFPDKSIPAPAKLYRCCGCGDLSTMTIDIAQVNLFCAACRRLALHDRTDEPKPVRATFKMFLNVVTPTPAPTREQVDATIASVLAQLERPAGINDVPMDYTFLLTPEPKPVYSLKDIAAVETLTKAISPAPFTRDVKDLADEFRERLKLTPFDEYQRSQRAWNVANGVAASEITRQTGRTTRGLLIAIANVVIRKINVMHILGGTEMNDRELVVQAWDLYSKLGLKTMEPLHTVRPAPYRYKPNQFDDAYLYTDHYWYERNARNGGIVTSER